MTMTNVYMRQFPSSFAVGDFHMEGDGRTVLGRIVPYGETISFVDPYDGGKVKQERFVPGAIAKQSSPGAWSRVLLSFQHEDGFENTIGYGRELQDREDGAYATFRLYQADADKAREMMEHSHKGLSMEFEARGRDEFDADGVIVRRNVRVRRVGITNDPAFVGAKVLAVRQSSVDLRAPDEPDVVATPHLDAIRAELAQLRGRWAQ
jgi:HK97 family phage prohead protease